MDGRSFAVHEPLGADDFCPKVLGDGLVPETDPEEGGLAREMINDGQADSRLVGGAGTGGNKNTLGLEVYGLWEGDLVIAVDFLGDA